MINKTVTITPIGEVSDFILKYIGEIIKNSFNLNTNYTTLQKIASNISFSSFGGRCNSTDILRDLSKRVPEDTYRLLAITELDIYSPIFSCLFGEAQLGGPCAIVSLHRLRQEYYNLPPDNLIFLSRYEKVVIHELAHTFGLIHCVNEHCVMYPSGNITETDIKSNLFCPRCTEQLKI
jgi:archaemetzincin